ncbi:MAG: hypothetical protein ACJ79S_17175, partial [Gemmatimonadaceae bacterium]
ATAALPRPRRAAALLAADRALAAAAPAVGTDDVAADSATAAAIARLGARYVFSPIGGAFVYGGNWLRQARALDPRGAAGELALLVQLETGFAEPLCDGPDSAGENFRVVRAEGERYLAAGGHDDASRSRVELAVADADRDLVALASGASEYADSASYLAGSPAARRRAIGHYRRFLALSRATGQSATPRARRAWLEAWRLLAGLPPAGLRYYCVYD